jgi:amino acid permease-like protein
VSAAPSDSGPAAGLARRLGTADAVVIGLGSMIGAGVFAAFGPAARAAGALLLVGLAVAAVIAYCNAVASAQLAAAYPTSGGTYIYGREQLGHWWGFAAGWGFVVGKTAPVSNGRRRARTGRSPRRRGPTGGPPPGQTSRSLARRTSAACTSSSLMRPLQQLRDPLHLGVGVAAGSGAVRVGRG